MAQFFARLDWRPIRAPSLLGLKSTLRAQYKATALIVPSSSSKSNLNSCVARNSSGPPKYSATARHGGEYAASSPSSPWPRTLIPGNWPVAIFRHDVLPFQGGEEGTIDAPSLSLVQSPDAFPKAEQLSDRSDSLAAQGTGGQTPFVACRSCSARRHPVCWLINHSWKYY
jgi:hypothetical protein